MVREETKRVYPDYRGTVSLCPESLEVELLFQKILGETLFAIQVFGLEARDELDDSREAMKVLGETVFSLEKGRRASHS